ncbi:MAG: efflux RND transporter periplasmic adaptor subunit [Bacteroidaceae bacterium]|nr:efflux RND transporter periplasmic adaptor subunit [Bacteroidaceae bacterium]
MVSCIGQKGHESEKEHRHSTDEDSAHEEHALGGEKHDSDEIIFTKECAKAAGLKVETVVAGDFREGIKTSGQVLAAQGDDETLVAKSSGVLKITATSLVEGAQVSGGKTLFSITSGSMSDGDVTNKSRIEYEAAVREYNRAADLAKDQLITQSELNELKLRMDVAKEALKYGKSATAASTTVSAPFNGFVKQLLVKNGEFVTAGQSLAVITKNKRLQLRADVSEKYYSHLEHITGANFRLTGSSVSYSIESLGGRLVSYGRSTASDVCFVPVIFEFNNVGNSIVAGSFCDVYMLGLHRSNVISVPIEAITEDQGLYYVFVQVDDEGYRKQEVEIGETDGLRREITRGLTAGDKVVVKGAVQVKLAGMSGTIPAHSHEH